MIDFCNQTVCENQGVCRPLVSRAICECIDGYFGEFCQETKIEVIIQKATSQSFAYIAIIAFCCVVAFVVVLDILKYCFGIDPAKEERERMREKKQGKKRRKKRRPVVQRFIYIPAPTDPSTPKRRLSIIEETLVE